MSLKNSCYQRRSIFIFNCIYQIRWGFTVRVRIFDSFVNLLQPLNSCNQIVNHFPQIISVIKAEAFFKIYFHLSNSLQLHYLQAHILASFANLLKPLNPCVQNVIQLSYEYSCINASASSSLISFIKFVAASQFSYSYSVSFVDSLTPQNICVIKGAEFPYLITFVKSLKH